MISTTMKNTIEDRMLKKKADKNFVIDGMMKEYSMRYVHVYAATPNDVY